MQSTPHILFLTWKDIRHPHRWGAEIVMYNYAKWLAEKWYRVTWLASLFAWASQNENIDGINIIRKFSANTIWMFAWYWYRKFRKENTIDVIIDEAGGWPLLSPMYEKKTPIFFFAHHIGDREFDTPWVIGPIAKLVYFTFFVYIKTLQALLFQTPPKNELVSDFGHKMKILPLSPMQTILHR